MIEDRISDFLCEANCVELLDVNNKNLNKFQMKKYIC